MTRAELVEAVTGALHAPCLEQQERLRSLGGRVPEPGHEPKVHQMLAQRVVAVVWPEIETARDALGRERHYRISLTKLAQSLIELADETNRQIIE